MFCINCGYQMGDDETFCRKCGKKADTILMQNSQVNNDTGKKKRIMIIAIALIIGVCIIVGVCIFAFAIQKKFQKVNAIRADEQISEFSPYEGQQTQTSEEIMDDESSQVQVYERNGDYIVFGHYEQDGDTSNGAEPIEWEVLNELDGELLLISKYILDAAPYNNVDEDVTWETCTLRDWLNDDFYNKAFSKNERSAIVETTLDNPDNEFYGTDGGNSTKDNVFLLSTPKVFGYYYFNSYYPEEIWGVSKALMTEATKYAVGRGVGIRTMNSDTYYYLFEEEDYDMSYIGKVFGVWWLRSPGRYSSSACTVNDFGGAGCGIYGDVDAVKVGVRPAIRIKA